MMMEERDSFADLEKFMENNNKSSDANDYAFIENGADEEDQAYLTYLKRAYPGYVLDATYHCKSRRGKEVPGLLGEGGYGRVYACRDASFHNEPRAVKIIQLNQHPLEKIKKEFDLQYRFRDVSVEPNPYPLVSDPKFFGVSMEMMEGTLRDLLVEHHNCFDAVDTVRIMKEVAGLVARLHNNEPSVAHFDIKPENILYKFRGRRRIFKLGDYGCAQDADVTITHVKRTEKYCSLNPTEPGRSRDIYALGIILMELQGVAITNENFAERYQPQFMWEHTEVPVDTDLREISRKTCSINIDDRYTIDGFMEALDNWLMEHKDEVSIKDDNAEVLLRKAEEFELGAGNIPIQMERAKKYYEAAAKKRSGKAAYRLYKIFDQDEETYSKEKVMEQLENSRNLNYAPAMNEYACRRIKELGPDGDPEEMMQMVELLRQASAASPAAAYNLAVLMKAGIAAENGEGEADQFLLEAVHNNYEAAIKLYDALNSSNSADAQE